MTPATLVSLPDASSTLSSAAAYSAPVFTTMLPFAMALVGLGLGGIFVLALKNTVILAISRIFSKTTDKFSA